GEGITRVWRERKLGAAEIICARRLCLYRRIVARACQFVSRLDRVLTNNLREIVLQRKVLAGLIGAAHGAQPVTEVEDRERQRGHVRYAQLLGPVLTVAQRNDGEGPPVIPEPELIK